MPLASVLLLDVSVAAGGGAIGVVDVLLVMLFDDMPPPAIGSQDVSMFAIDDDEVAGIDDDIDILDEVPQPIEDDEPAILLAAAAAAFLCLVDWASENRGAEAMPQIRAAAAQMRRIFIWFILVERRKAGEVRQQSEGLPEADYAGQRKFRAWNSPDGRKGAVSKLLTIP